MATASIIELECPNCQTLLELDTGFAGGVCRCFNCGTLMTVPADPVGGRPERLLRPDRPDAPGGGRPTRPQGAAPAPAPPRDRDADEFVEAEVDLERPPGSAALPRSAPKHIKEVLSASSLGVIDAGTYVTESGKKVNVTPQSVPVARLRRRAMIRRGTIAIVGITLGIVIALLAAGLLYYMHYLSEQRPYVPTEVTRGYNPSINPLTMDQPNIVQIELQRGRVVVALEAGTIGGESLDFSRRMVLHAASRLPAATQMQVIWWGQNAVDIMPRGGPGSFAGDDLRALERFQRFVTTAGVGQPQPGLEAALRSAPDQIIFVTGQRITEEDIQAMTQMLQGRTIRFDAVSIGIDDEPLETLVGSHRGTYVMLTPEQIHAWMVGNGD